MSLTSTWADFHDEPKVKANPRYPRGRRLDTSMGAHKTCEIELPYPAKRLGAHLIKCDECGLRVAVTTAGRTDDPTWVKVACKDGG